MNAPHPWKLVAPWYRWPRQLAGEGRQPRQTRPVFQKFDDPGFVKSFTRDPQRSLRFVAGVDTVSKTVLTSISKLGTGPMKDRFTRLFAPREGKNPPTSASDATLIDTGVRKLFLPTHKRFYLVVCELHCDLPGFPTTTPDQVCQAGFVVRRSSFSIPEAGRGDAATILEQISHAQVEIAYWEQTAPAKGAKLQRRADAVQKATADGTLPSKLAAARSRLAAGRESLGKWRAESGVQPILEGWIASPFESIGSWQEVEPVPPQLVESSFPLYALFPDPAIPGHTARGKNIYFGMVPTSSLETDSAGIPRFDSEATYEIRCFVRRHKPGCPRGNDAPDCPGELVWSEPTEPFKLATPLDLFGTSQRPMTIQMPDLAELAAHALAFPVEKFAPMRIVQPQSLSFNVDDGKAKGGRVGLPQICFFAIPLITIVAFFVLSLFLPILVFLFGLFFLLQLKFCIPPSVKIDAKLKAELDIIPPNFDADFSVDVEVGGVLVDLNADLQAGIAADAGITATADKDQLNIFSNAALLPLGKAIQRADTVATTGATGVDYTASLEFEPRVEVPA